MSLSDQLAQALSRWPLDREQREFIKGATTEANERQIKDLVRQLGDAESAVIGYEDLRTGQNSTRSGSPFVQRKLRIIRRHKWIVAILGTIMLAAITLAIAQIGPARTEVRIAAGPSGSVYVRLVQLLAEETASRDDRIKLRLVLTSGSPESAAALENDRADVAILPSTIGDAPDWPLIAILRRNVLGLIVPQTNAADKLDAVPKLAGHRLGIVTGDEATTDILKFLLSRYAVFGKVQVSLVDPAHVAAAVKNKQIDALFVVSSVSGEAIDKLIVAATVNGQAPGFIAIDHADGIAKRNPAFQAMTLDAGMFGDNPALPPEDIRTLGFIEYLVANKKFDRYTVASLAKRLYASRLTLAAAMPGEIKIEAPKTDKDASKIVHPGALMYLQGEQSSFLDRYGDDIFYVLLILPVVASAIAGFVSYFRNDARVRRMRMQQRLMGVLRKARTASSLEVLDEVQVEVDHLVIAMIHYNEQYKYNQNERMLFLLALDHISAAIASRQTLLREPQAHDPTQRRRASVA
jgi:TRAP-type uncharacterized transport system substrate-binding protein